MISEVSGTDVQRHTNQCCIRGERMLVSLVIYKIENTLHVVGHRLLTLTDWYF